MVMELGGSARVVMKASGRRATADPAGIVVMEASGTMTSGGGALG